MLENDLGPINQDSVNKFKQRAETRELVKEMLSPVEKKQDDLVNLLAEKLDELGKKVEANKPIPAEKIVFPDPVKPPDVQKVTGGVNVLNQLTAVIKNLPAVQKIVGSVAVNNWPERQKVEVVNPVEMPSEMKVKVLNQLTFPIAKGSKPSKEADPTAYVPIRLTDGRQFIDKLTQTAEAATYGGAKQKEWPQVTISYDGSGNPTSIVKQDGNVKVTKEIRYDGSNNPISIFTKNEVV